MHHDRGEVDLALDQSVQATVVQMPLVEPIDLPLVAARIGKRRMNPCLRAPAEQGVPTG
jgi:hypothetical protein